MLYLVSYDLNKDKDYEKLYKELKNSSNWWHYLDSTWLVVTQESIKSFRDRIKSKMDDDDTLLVFNVTNQEYSGWLTDKAWNWIRKHING